MNNRLKKVLANQEEILKRLDSLQVKSENEKEGKRSSYKQAKDKGLKEKQQELVNNEYDRIIKNGDDFQKRVEHDKEKEKEYRESNPNWEKRRKEQVERIKSFLRQKMSYKKNG